MLVFHMRMCVIQTKANANRYKMHNAYGVSTPNESRILHGTVCSGRTVAVA